MNENNFSYMHFLNEGKWQKEREKDRTEVIRKVKIYIRRGRDNIKLKKIFFIFPFQSFRICQLKNSPTSKKYFLNKSRTLHVHLVSSSSCVCLHSFSITLQCHVRRRIRKNVFMYQKIFL